MSAQALSPLEQLGQQQTVQPTTPSDLSPLEQLAQQGAPAQGSPQQTGEITNDVGNTVIVPKNLGGDNEESFSDTLKRAVEHHKAMGAAADQEAIDKETGTIPKKAAEVALSTPIAAALPIAGAEGLLAAHTAMSAGFKALAPAMQKGIEGIGEWAEAHPYARAILIEALKKVATGTAVYAGAKAAGKVIKSASD